MRRDLFHYDLPPELIAQRPLPVRRDARLLTLDGTSGAIADRQVADLATLLERGDLLVFNDTRVINARLFGTKQTGGRVELLIERVSNSTEVLAQIRSNKPLKPGSVLTVGDQYRFKLVGRDHDLYRLTVEPHVDVNDVIERFGRVPLPPYIARDAGDDDLERYQTIFARVAGAVAAPTAGLHFDQTLMQQLAEREIDIGFVTLHVGAGTFQPVRSVLLEDHRMHAECFEVSEKLCRQVESARAANKRVVAVGTTTVRALESACVDGRIRPRRGETDIFIFPDYRFRIVDALLTNFHLPESTLLMLVSAFASREYVLGAYRHAIRERYRFFSYGDAMWVTHRRPA